MGKKGNRNNRIFESNLMANGVMLADAPLQMCVQSLCICEMVGMVDKVGLNRVKRQISKHQMIH